MGSSKALVSITAVLQMEAISFEGACVYLWSFLENAIILLFPSVLMLAMREDTDELRCGTIYIRRRIFLSDFSSEDICMWSDSVCVPDGLRISMRLGVHMLRHFPCCIIFRQIIIGDSSPTKSNGSAIGVLVM